jgi:hypothetical protein
VLFTQTPQSGDEVRFFLVQGEKKYAGRISASILLAGLFLHEFVATI